ncbi:hypothetical protein ZHAS_00018983 [Anopheles sinensis]|uniref:Uncharacterized protein n=1 Tax=Anopheles sinensis TaxID=74873 RepID=A0A084WL49_ANOSI|nr:hypothetical protein ZHAS_00018983 [Anopheles sinensis]
MQSMFDQTRHAARSRLKPSAPKRRPGSRSGAWRWSKMEMAMEHMCNITGSRRDRFVVVRYDP